MHKWPNMTQSKSGFTKIMENSQKMLQNIDSQRLSQVTLKRLSKYGIAQMYPARYPNSSQTEFV